MAAYRYEKKILSELLKMYKDATCLWNPVHSGYTNKVVRQRALLALVEKYRALDPAADVARLKKKLENMRTTYKRERLKVRKSSEDEQPYEPSLWYFPLLRFLDELEGEGDALAGGGGEGDSEPLYTDQCEETESPPEKKFKAYSTQEQELESVETLAYSSDEEPPYLIQRAEPPRGGGGGGGGGEPYARAMAARLAELRPQQRYIAEKLLSDVIFLGRLNKLRTGTTIEINEDI